MKKQTGIWIDSSKAILVTLSEGKETVSEVLSELEHGSAIGDGGDKGAFMGSTHLNHERKFDERKNHQLDRFIKKVIGTIQDHDEFYVFGPAETKTRLKQGISSEPGLADKLKSIETSDSMTMNQVVAKVKEFFKP